MHGVGLGGKAPREHAGGAAEETQRLLWIDEAGKPWMAVVKLTRYGEVYLQSYRRGSSTTGGRVDDTEGAEVVWRRGRKRIWT